MKVRQVLLGQSASARQPLPTFVPPTHAAVSQVPDVQSPSEQHAVPSLVQRPVSLVHVPDPQFPLSLPQPTPARVQSAPGVEPPAHRMGMRSAVRKSCELSGTFKLVVLPILQSPVPAASPDSTLMTQVLVAAPLCEVFGTGSGGPNKHPAFVH